MSSSLGVGGPLLLQTLALRGAGVLLFSYSVMSFPRMRGTERRKRGSSKVGLIECE